MTDLKHYRPLTLVENWGEDRALPLANRVLPDYGDRRYTTEQRDAFPAPANAALNAASPPAGPQGAAARLAVRAQGAAGLYAMTRLSSWEDAARPREPSAAAPSAAAFGTARVDGDAAAPSSSQWRTTHQASFGIGASPAAVAAARAEGRRADAPWVVGRSGPRREVGRGTSGCLGEVYKTEPNPQVNTAVQRSWLYYKDPMLCYKDGEAPAPPPRPRVVASLPGLGDSDDVLTPYDPIANRRRVAKLTRYADPKMHPLPGARVFADQDEAVPTLW